jgi:hypothetical protein
VRSLGDRIGSSAVAETAGQPEGKQFVKVRARVFGLVLAGVLATALNVVGTQAAHAAPAGTSAISLTGSWTDNGSAMPSIIQGGVGGDNLVVNMSYAHRPTAFGKVTGATTFFVTFPDAGTITGTAPRDGVIQWSNGSVWRKVFTGQLVSDISGTWVDPVSTQHITNAGGYLRVIFDNGRPAGIGFVGNASTIQVTFPGDATYLATVDPDGFLRWSNNTTWTRPVIE